RGQGAHLDQRRHWKVASKKFAPCLPDFFAARDIGDKDVHLHDVIHVATGRLDEVLELGEHGTSLLVHAATARDLGTGARSHTGREHLIPHYETIRPGLRGWLSHLGTTDALLRWHMCLLSLVIAWWTSKTTKLAFEQGSKMDRRTILQIRAN